MKGDLEQSPDAINAHNEYAAKVELNRRENVNANTIRRMRNELVKIFEDTMLRREALRNPLPLPKEVCMYLCVYVYMCICIRMTISFSIFVFVFVYKIK